MKLAVRGALVAIVVSLCCQRPVQAQTFLQYLQFPAGTPSHPTPLTMPMTLNLPCYGNVLVSVSPNPPVPTAPLGVTRFHQTAAENRSPQNNPSISWGADTDRFNVLAGGSSVDYTITFTFLNGPADSSRLYLIVAGLANYAPPTIPCTPTSPNCTTATVATTPATAAGTLVGELRIPITPTLSSSTTVQTGSTMSSQGDGDPVNTGWAIYRPQPGASLSDISVAMHQANGDGAGWTLSYQCTSASGSSPAVPTLSATSMALLIVLVGVTALVALGRSVRW